MHKWAWTSLCVLCLVAILFITLTRVKVKNQPPVENSLTVAEALGSSEATGYARATEIREFVFPLDHGPHHEFKTEWWYYTGNLFDENGRHFGYQLTFFRTALTPHPTPRPSNWATHQAYMAHFALTDTKTGKFYYFERFSRSALGLAGASAVPFRVWLEDWGAEGDQLRTFPMRLSAQEGEVAIDFNLESTKPMVLQGQKGLSQKSSQPGNASYYYSITRMPTYGKVKISNQTFTVRGTSWLDREWSTSALGEDQVGWDWFSLQFNDGRELMYYQLRRQDGTADPFSSGLLVEKNGSIRQLTASDVEIQVLDFWRSPESGATYPSKWAILIANEDMKIEITPRLAHQELNTSIRYWEGAVSARGSLSDRTLLGNGYVELTGY
ncbi:MAG: carotenoid 1,2-hydratase [Deltaproteobacteria bacterium]|jgi:predicted secreted hydrolase|nr:carotenoid 1,2-hydratase [Deltaproteobacteria bacterium]